MKIFSKIITVFVFFHIGIFGVDAQIDSSKSDMTFDIGLTRSKEAHLWPLVVKTKTLEKSDLQIFFSIYGLRKEIKNQRIQSHLLPVYWKTKDSLSSDFRFLTIYYPSIIRVTKNLSSDSLRSFKFFDLAPQINFMEVTKSTNGTFVQNNLFFFIWYKNNRELNKMYFVTFPLYWSFKNSERTSSTLLPFYSYGKFNNNKDNYFAVTPLFWHINKARENKNVLFPIWWNKKSITDAGICKSNVFFPLIWSYKKPDHQSFTLLPLFSWYRSEINDNEQLLLTPLFWHKQDKYESKNVLFPIWWQNHNKFGSNPTNTNVIFPFYWYKKDNNIEKEILFPFVWSIKNSQYYSLTFFPLFSKGASTYNNKTHLAISPLFWHLTENGTHRNILFPIYWSTKNQNINNKVFFPIIWSINNTEHNSFTFFPLISKGHSADSTSSYLMLSPLLWSFKHHESNLNILMPIAWQRKTGTGEYQKISSVVFPIFWAKKDKYHQNQILFPLVWNLKNTHYKSFTFLPLFSEGKSADKSVSHLIITPLFWKFNKNNDSKSILFPVYWHMKSGEGENSKLTNIIFPIYWSKKNQYHNNKVLFPLIWNIKNPDYHSFTFFPLFSKGNSTDSTSKYLVLTPLLWHFKNNEETFNVFFPFGWQKIRGSGNNQSRIIAFLPLYWSKKDKNHDNKIFFPLVWSLKGPTYHSLTILPLFSGGHSIDSLSDHLTISPLFWHVKNVNYTRNILFPFWWQKRTLTGDDNCITNFIFPLYYSKRDKEHNNQVLFPFVWSIQNSYYHSFTFFPFYSKGHSLDKKSSHLMLTPLLWEFEKENSSMSILFPFSWIKKKKTDDGEHLTQILFPLYWAKTDSYRKSKVLFPIVWSLKNRYYRSFTLFPLYSKGYSADSSKTHLMLSPLVWQLKDNDKELNLLVPFLWQKKTGLGDKMKIKNVVFPIFWSEKSKLQNSLVLFPFLWRYKTPYYQSLTFLPLFSNGHSPDSLNSHLMLTPFFWHLKNNNITKNILFPLWIQKKTNYEDYSEKINYIFPLYWSKKDKNCNNKVLFPLIWRYKNKYHQSFTLFPIFSMGHKIDKSRHHLMITPLFWEIKNRNIHKVTLIPLFYYSANSVEKEKHFNILYFLARYKSLKERKSFSLLWPICEYKKDIDYKYFRFAPIIWYKKAPESNYFSIQPFYFHSKDSTCSSYRFLWELFTYRNYFNYKTSRNLLWKAVIWDKYQNSDHEFRLLYFLYANVNKNGYFEKGIFPLYSSKKESNGNTSFSVFFSFYNSFKRQIPDSKEFYMEDKIFWFIRIRSNYKALEEKGLKYK